MNQPTLKSLPFPNKNLHSSSFSTPISYILVGGGTTFFEIIANSRLSLYKRI